MTSHTKHMWKIHFLDPLMTLGFLLGVFALGCTVLVALASTAREDASACDRLDPVQYVCHRR